MALNEFRNRDGKFLNLSQLKQYCPAAYSAKASSETSKRYDFISTQKIISALACHDIMPYSVSQSRARSQEKLETTKHMVRFRHINSRASHPSLKVNKGLWELSRKYLESGT